MNKDMILSFLFLMKKIIDLFDYLFENIKHCNDIFICYDLDEDISIKIGNQSKYRNVKKIKLLKNPLDGPCEAVKYGLNESRSEAAIVYPADDFFNGNILDKMYDLSKEGYDIVCPSRFIKGGLIKNCPLIKFIIVKCVSISLYYFSSLKIKDQQMVLDCFLIKF